MDVMIVNSSFRFGMLLDLNFKSLGVCLKTSELMLEKPRDSCPSPDKLRRV